MIEIEKRALVPDESFDSVIAFLDSRAQRQKQIKRFTLVNVPDSTFIQDPANPIDLKVRLVSGKGVLTLKKGSWHSAAAREEYEVDFDPQQLPELLNILVALNKKFFVATYVTRLTYVYGDFTITLDHFLAINTRWIEVEISSGDALKAEQSIDHFLRELDLRPLDSKTTKALIDQMNGVVTFQINFDVISIEQWCESWTEFIECKK